MQTQSSIHSQAATTINKMQQLQPPPRVVSARYADLKVEQTKNSFLEREKELYGLYVEQKTRANLLEADNSRLRDELERFKSKHQTYSDEDRQQARKSHEQHLGSLYRHNQQLAASTALVLDALMQHYSQKLLPPHLPPPLSGPQIHQLAHESLATRPCKSQEEWNQRLVVVSQNVERKRQADIRQAIASDLNDKIKAAEDGSKRLAELEFAIVDCEKSLNGNPDAPEGKTETMREMVQLLKTEREILVQGLERGQKRVLAIT